MSNSLRDQLLKTGLVSNEQAKKAENRAKTKTHNQQKKKKSKTPKVADTESATYQAVKAREAEISRAQELNRQREAERQQKALQAQVHDIIKQHQVNDPDADILYNFIDNKSIRQILVNAKQQQQLVNGHLAITILDESYYLMPATAVAALLERMPETVIYFVKDAQPIVAEDDPYKDYQVPDDLMW